MSALTPEQMLDALFRGMNSGVYWMSTSIFGPDDMSLYLYPVDGPDTNHVQDRDPIAVFSGSRTKIMTELVAYQMAERLTS